MSTGPGNRGAAEWLELERQLMSSAVARLRAGEEQFQALIVRATANIAALAQTVETKQAEIELKPRPPVELDACLQRLRADGPVALSGRERRALVAHPDRVPARDAERVLRHSPELLRHLVRAVLSNWYQYRGQAWGAEYLNLVCAIAKGSAIPLLEGAAVGPGALLARGNPSGDAQLAATLTATDISVVHRQLKDDLGLRDSWLYTGQVLASWLETQVQRGKPLDGTLQAIRQDPRLRALLLPSRVANTNAVAGVRVDTLAQARSLATFLRAAFGSPPLLAKASLAELSDDALHSDFNDPRMPPLSQGWQLVKQLAEEPFRRFLASMSEQDLEVFFAHAMNEPDRRKFWMRYLSQIERTGCVLDRASQDSLKAKLEGSAELKGAIGRAYRFRRASGVQAFFLVFARVVVVEFSDNGNAAYVYEREYFEQKIEKNVRGGRCDSAPDLKVKSARIHKFDHHRNWQEKAEQWLSEQGIHARGRRP